MKAATNQIPVENKDESLENTFEKGRKADNLWAAIRRNKAQIDALTQQVSTLRRDYNRLNSKYYREEAKLQPQEENTGGYSIPREIAAIIGEVH